MKNKLLIVLVFLLINISCKKEKIEPFISNGKNKTSDLIVNYDFNWRTTKEYKINLIGYANSPLLIININGNIIENCMLFKNKTYSTNIVVPTYEKTIILNYMGQIIKIDLSSEEINYTFN
jgi:hypothetical protein